MNYSTRDRIKATALVNALIDAEFDVALVYHQHHYHLQTTASPEQFAVARASIGIPSSNPSPDMPNPDAVSIPDTLADMWADNMDD